MGANELLEPMIGKYPNRSDLIASANLIIWDEAPMAHIATFNCVHETCQLACQNYLPFGGKSIILLGDFRQTCPIVRGSSRHETVEASIKSSPLWQLFQQFQLTTPIRQEADPHYAEFVSSIGDGAGPIIDLSSLPFVHDFHDLIKVIYPTHILRDPNQCVTRAILALTNHQVDIYNTAILNTIDEPAHTYFATDTLKEATDIGLAPPSSILEYAAAHTFPGLPPFTLLLKTNTVCRLLRNLSIDRGLVKNTRVLITNLGKHLITVRIINNQSNIQNHHSEDILIPRITFSVKIPAFAHTLNRKQFPLAPCYATTFTSSQGLTLDYVGVDLIYPPFNHGQLYTALSRIRTHKDICLRLPPHSTSTYNITYHELLT